MSVLITGGLGYIGSHTAVELLKWGIDVIVIDNLCNSKKIVESRITEITKKSFKVYLIDLLDEEAVENVFINNNITSIIHFAALKSVSESIKNPIEYYHNNMTSTLVILKLMKKYGIKKLVFSSSATVYGNTLLMPIKEDGNLAVTNPYGRTKLMTEDILKDVYKANNNWDIAILRYFNPIGAHESGIIGEDPNGIPNNLLPYISKVAVGELKEVSVYGNDYPTIDGTGVRDYIHVVDLAKGHIKALEKLNSKSGLFIYNLGTGKGSSVLQMINTFKKVAKKDIPYKIVGRRAGDVAECYADPSKANKELGWQAEKDIEEMCMDAWNWQCKNPNGYN